MGTPEFAVPSLDALIANDYNVCAVFTKPDKPQGRKQIMTFPPIKQYALDHNLDVYQPEKVKALETIELMKKLAPDLIVVVAYGKILPKEILDIPKYGCVNVHGSLLPKYRGAAPIQWSIINGDKITGVTTMFINEGLDTGDILLQQQMFINEYETSDELKQRMSVLGAKVLIKTIEKIEDGTLNPLKQNDSEATFSPPLDKLGGNIDWTKSAQTIHNLVRGCNSWPIAHTILRGKLFKIYKSKVSTLHSTYPGKVISLNPLIIGCGDGTSLELLEVQIEGKKRMSAADFARGFRLSEKTVLGTITTNHI